MNYINREVESQIKEFCKMFAVIAVTGPRQVGKSTTLKKIFSQKYKYFSLDDPEIRALAINDPKSFIEKIGDYCIIDEAQYSPDLFSCIKIRTDSDPSIKGRFILSGSQHFHLMKNITESLAGRVGIINMSTLSISEIRSYKNKISSEDYFYLASLRSGYPEPFINHNIKIDVWFNSYIQSYVQRDIRTLYNIGKIIEFESFIKILAAQAAQVMNLNRISKGLGVAVNTLKNWVSILEASGIIYILSPYYSNITKRFTKNPKVFFTDTGLLCYLLGIDSKSELKKSPMYGSIFENYCIMETIKYFKNRISGLKKNFYFLREQDRLEIDLLIESERKLYPIEIKISYKENKKTIENIEKLIFSYKSLPVDKAFILSLIGPSTQINPYLQAVGLDDYIKILEKI